MKSSGFHLLKNRDPKFFDHDEVIITSSNETRRNIQILYTFPSVPLQITKLWMHEEDYKDIVKFSK